MPLIMHYTGIKMSRLKAVDHYLNLTTLPLKIMAYLEGTKSHRSGNFLVN